MSDSLEGVYAAAAVHPGELQARPENEVDAIPGILTGPGVLAVGETGMDLYHDAGNEMLQRDVFRRHIEMAEAFGLTLVVHSRNAEAQVLEELGGSVGVPVVMHCYTGSVELGLEAAGRGFYIGFAGPVTYRANGYLRELASRMPFDRILAETDSPYLSPQPVRGARNQPANLVYIVETLAEIRDMDLDTAAAGLRENSLRAFQLGEHRRTDLIYGLYGNLYMNITGKCSNRCRFCIRDRTDGLGGYYLRHSREPDRRRLRSIMDLLPAGRGEEMVFCGYGEPTMRPELLRELAGTASSKGYRVRLNTNGTCLLRMSGEGTIRMLEPFDSVSVSLNAPSGDDYRRICRPDDPAAWDRLLDFIRLAAGVVEVRATAVRYPGVDMNAVKELAASMDVPFRER